MGMSTPIRYLKSIQNAAVMGEMPPILQLTDPAMGQLKKTAGKMVMKTAVVLLLRR